MGARYHPPITPDEQRQMDQRLRELNAERPIRGTGSKARMARIRRKAGVLSVIRRDARSSAWGRRLLSARGGHAMSQHARELQLRCLAKGRATRAANRELARRRAEYERQKAAGEL